MKAPSIGSAAASVLRFVRPTLLGAALLGVGVSLRLSAPVAAEQPRALPAPLVDESAQPGATFEVAVLAGGCFWGVQGVFQHVKGVTSAVSGYSGGEKSTAEYETVSTGATGHAEIGESHVRSPAGQLRPSSANLLRRRP